MKRLNPKTGEVFKLRDLREDGFIFIGYQKTRKIKKNWVLSRNLDFTRSF